MSRLGTIMFVILAGLSSMAAMPTQATLSQKELGALLSIFIPTMFIVSASIAIWSWRAITTFMAGNSGKQKSKNSMPSKEPSSKITRSMNK